MYVYVYVYVAVSVQSNKLRNALSIPSPLMELKLGYFCGVGVFDFERPVCIHKKVSTSLSLRSRRVSFYGLFLHSIQLLKQVL